MVMVVVTAKEYKGRGWRSGWGEAQKVHNHGGSLLTLVGTLNVIIFR